MPRSYSILNMTGTTLPLFESFTELPPEPFITPADHVERRCPCRDNVVAEDEGVLHDDGLHCPDCVQTCEGCDETTTNEDEIQPAFITGFPRYGRIPITHLCTGCRFGCADCSRQFANSVEEHLNARDERICGGCSENYSSCQECGCMLHTDNTHSDGDGDGVYCEDCIPSARSEGPIYDYGYKPVANFHRLEHEKKGGMYLGVEIETEPKRDNRELSDDVQGCGLASSYLFYCKEDGSISDGFEIVSHPATLAYWQSYTWEFTDKLRKRGYQSYNNDGCGMHVHVSKRCLSKYAQYKLLRFFKLNKLLVTCLSRRRDISHLNTYANLGDDWKRKGNRPLINKVKYEDARRYEAVNVLNAETIEIRIFQGTLVPASIHRNIALVAALVHYVNQCGARQLRARQFVAWLRKDGWRSIGVKDAMNLDKWICTVTPDKTEEEK